MRVSRKQESELAASVGGSVTPGSGNQWSAKGDVQSKRFLIECKTREKHSFMQWWLKIKAEAIIKGKEPVLQLSVGSHMLAVIDLELFLELTEK